MSGVSFWPSMLEVGGASIQVVTAGYTSERKRLAGQCHAEKLPLQEVIAIWIASCEPNLGVQVLRGSFHPGICAAKVYNFRRMSLLTAIV
jgi:hypothetical protein